MNDLPPRPSRNWSTPPPPPPSSTKKKKGRFRPFSVGLTEQQYQFLRETAEKTGQHMSEVIRSLITQAMVGGGVVSPEHQEGLIARLMSLFRRRSVTITEEEWIAAASRKKSPDDRSKTMSPERMKIQLELMNELKEKLKERRVKSEDESQLDTSSNKIEDNA